MKEREIGAANAIIYKVQTTVDNGARITLDLGAESSDLILKLLHLKMMGDDYITIGMCRADKDE